MKKIFGLLMLLLMVALFSNIVLAEDNSSGNVGVGMGIPYGIIGANFEIGSSDYIVFTAGAGICPYGYDSYDGTYAGYDLGYAVGMRAYFADREQTVRPRLGIYMGTVAVEETYYYSNLYDHRMVEGTAIGFGLDIRIRRVTLDPEVVYISTYDSDLEIDSRVKLSIGVHFK